MKKNTGEKLLIFVEIVALLVVAVFGVFRLFSKDNTKKPKSIDTGVISSTEVIPSGTEVIIVDTEGASDTDDANSFSDSVLAKVGSMTTEEKVCQLFMTRPEEITGVAQFTNAGNKTKAAISQYPLGGFVFGQPNFGGIAATQAMMGNVQSYANERSGFSMFLAVAEVGGDNSPLAKANAISIVNDPMTEGTLENAGEDARKMSAYIGQNGLNMNLTAYSGDVDKMAAVTAGYKENMIHSIVGTYPNEGATDITSVDDMFSKSIETDVSVIMIGAYANQSFTGDAEMSCVVSGNVMSHLRYDMNYEGIIMTADLSKGVSGGMTQDEAAVAAVKSGVDMVWVSTGFVGSYNAVLEAVNKGEISEEVLNNAVARILTVKGL